MFCLLYRSFSFQKAAFCGKEVFSSKISLLGRAKIWRFAMKLKDRLNPAWTKDTLTESQYIRMIALTTLVAMIVVLMGAYSVATIEPTWAHYVIFSALAFSGAFVFVWQSDWAVSAIAVTAMSGCIGAMIGFAPTRITEGMVITVFAMGIMTGIVMLFPKVVGSWRMYAVSIGPALTISIATLIDTRTSNEIWIRVAITAFSAYTAFSWNDAMNLPWTADNAIDTAGSLLLNVLRAILKLYEVASALAERAQVQEQDQDDE